MTDQFWNSFRFHDFWPTYSRWDLKCSLMCSQCRIKDISIISNDILICIKLCNASNLMKFDVSDVAHFIVVTSFVDVSSYVAHAIVVTSCMDTSCDVAHTIVFRSVIYRYVISCSTCYCGDVKYWYFIWCRHAIVVTSYMDTSSDVAHAIVETSYMDM